MEQNDNKGSGSTGGLGSTGGGLGGSSGSGLGGSAGGMGGSGLGGSAGGMGGSGLGSEGAVTGSGSTGSGFGSQPGTAGGFDDDFGTHETHVYRGDFEARTDRPETHTYEQARTGYQMGHTAAARPEYQNRDYQEVEVELEQTHEKGRFTEVREYVRSGFEWKRVLGGLALAGGAYWAGKKALEAVSEGKEEETHYRRHYEAHPARTTVAYPQARTYYVVGYTAARNPDYTGRSFEDVEPEIRRGFTGSRAGTYESMRDFCRYGYERGTGRAGGTGGMGGTGSTGGMGGTGGTGGTGGAGGIGTA
ncbi:MAG TPA: hypothetical protein VK420_20960 [Longimicrobium sp.]|nr:hypothetical protein [Longimicrobium sp.]